MLLHSAAVLFKVILFSWVVSFFIKIYFLYFSFFIIVLFVFAIIDISSINNTANCLIGTTSVIFGDAPSRAQQKVEKGDILVSMVRPNLKNIAIIDVDGNNLVASSGFCVLRTAESSNQFLKTLVLTPHFTEYLVKRVTGANYPAVREDDIKNCLIGVPPMSLQLSYSKRIEAIERQKQQINMTIKDLETLLASRMQYWFD